MVRAISIGTSKNPNALINKFDDHFKTLKSEGIEFKYKINNVGDIIFLGCDLSDKKFSNIDLKGFLAAIITDIIVEDWALILVKRIIRTHYYFFNEEEKKCIIEKALELLKDQKNNFCPLNRRKKIFQKVIDYLERNQQLVLEGFVNFRLKDYMLEIEEIVDIAADNFLEEKEYLEFIRLLRYFVDIQEPKIKEINIIFAENNAFKLLDKEGKQIENEFLDGFSIDFINNSINYEDLLISALITLAPEKIYIHLYEKVSKETIKTIENVFGKRVKYCSGCSLCKN